MNGNNVSNDVFSIIGVRRECFKWEGYLPVLRVMFRISVVKGAMTETLCINSQRGITSELHYSVRDRMTIRETVEQDIRMKLCEKFEVESVSSGGALAFLLHTVWIFLGNLVKC